MRDTKCDSSVFVDACTDSYPCVSNSSSASRDIDQDVPMADTAPGLHLLSNYAVPSRAPRTADAKGPESRMLGRVTK